MEIKNEVREENQRPGDGEGTAFTLFAGWLQRQFKPNADNLRLFTESLLKTFGAGLPVSVLGAGQWYEWYATLDAIDSEDKQVAALVRLSCHRPAEPREPRSTFVAFEERGRNLFEETPATCRPADSDLLLMYSFPILISLEENLTLFREFATNELKRLRVSVGEANAV